MAIKQYILDTCIFNWLLDGRILIEDLPSDGVFVATSVQRAELRATRSDVRRTALLAKFEEIGPELVPPESFMFDVDGAGFDEARWSDGKTYHHLKTALDRIHDVPSNVQDALIAEVALKHGMALVTADQNLRSVAEQFGIVVDFLPAKPCP